MRSIRAFEANRAKARVILSGVGPLEKARLRDCKVLPDEQSITDVNRPFLTFERAIRDSCTLWKRR